jgi:hypothetical protein
MALRTGKDSPKRPGSSARRSSKRVPTQLAPVVRPASRLRQGIVPRLPRLPRAAVTRLVRPHTTGARPRTGAESSAVCFPVRSGAGVISGCHRGSFPNLSGTSSARAAQPEEVSAALARRAAGAASARASPAVVIRRTGGPGAPNTGEQGLDRGHRHATSTTYEARPMPT